MIRKWFINHLNLSVLILFAGLLPASTSAKDNLLQQSNITSLKGWAQVVWTKKNKIYRFDQAINIQNKNMATFESIDDFGNTLFTIFFVGDEIVLAQYGLISEKRFKKILSFPLSKSEFLSYLMQQTPTDQKDLKITTRSDGKIESIEKKSKKNKNNYKIFFFDYKNLGMITYPYRIKIESRNASFTILWKKISLNP